MAEKSLRCKVITRESSLLDATVKHAEVPLWDGQAGFLPGAAPFVAKLGLGELRVDLPSGESRSWALDGGFMQVVGNVLTVLTSEATPVDELDPETCRAELAEANARKASEASEMGRITHERRRAQARLTLAHRK